jgi:hypothetical protein
MEYGKADGCRRDLSFSLNNKNSAYSSLCPLHLERYLFWWRQYWSWNYCLGLVADEGGIEGSESSGNNVTGLTSTASGQKLKNGPSNCYQFNVYWLKITMQIILSCLVVGVPGYRSSGRRFDFRSYQIFWDVVSLERGPLSPVNTTEGLLGRNSSGSGLENREYGRGDLLRWPRDILYPQKLALTSPTSGGRSVGIVRLRPKATECFLIHIYKLLVCIYIM